MESKISPDEYIPSSYFEDHWFTRDITNCVACSNREEDIRYLQNFLGGIAKIDGSREMTFSSGALKKYLIPRYQKFQKYVFKLRKYSLDDFRYIKISPELFELKSCVNDEFGYYVISENDDIQTFDEWIRWHDLTKPYYIGSTFDYSF